jgi:hypothetical protein
MIWSRATADDFFAANAQTGCINLLSLAVREGGMVPLSAIGEFWSGRFEAVEDINDYLTTAYIVRYKPNSEGKDGWQYSGSSNYSIDEYAEAIRTGKLDWKRRRDVLGLVDLLKEGLNADLIFTGVMDNSLGVRLIVDGVHRATALTLIQKDNPSQVNKLLASNYQILLIELRSKWGHVLYPVDFLDLCARRGP